MLEESEEGFVESLENVVDNGIELIGACRMPPVLKDGVRGLEDTNVDSVIRAG